LSPFDVQLVLVLQLQNKLFYRCEAQVFDIQLCSVEGLAEKRKTSLIPHSKNILLPPPHTFEEINLVFLEEITHWNVFLHGQHLENVFFSFHQNLSIDETTLFKRLFHFET
jgi:hypothetical protein